MDLHGMGVEEAIGNNALQQALSVFIQMKSTHAFAEDALARAGVPPKISKGAAR